MNTQCCQNNSVNKDFDGTNKINYIIRFFDLLKVYPMQHGIVLRPQPLFF